MEDITLAYLEAPATSPVTTHEDFHHWKLTVEAACWLHSNIWERAIDVEFCIEYFDAMKKHRVTIDRCRIQQLSDGLMTGRFTFKGFGPLRNARLVLKTTCGADLLDAQDITFNVVSSGLSRANQYRLVA